MKREDSKVILVKGNRTDEELATKILTTLYRLYAEQEGLELTDIKITKKDQVTA